MTRLHRPLLALSLSLLAWAGPTTGGAQAAERGPLSVRRALPVVEDASAARVIVKYRSDSTLMRALAVPAGTGATGTAAAGARPQHAQALSQRLGLPLTDGLVLGARTQALRGVGLSSSQLAARLAAQADVEWAVPDERRRIAALPNDPYFGDRQGAITPAAGQWYLRAPTAALPAAVNAVGAWDLTSGRADITVAVLDTGVRRDHPDLAGKLHPGYDFIDDPGTANDGDGRDADPSDPGDWTNANECEVGEPAYPSSWHGTQVAGLIGAATDNGFGMAGIGRNVMLLPVRVLGRCGGWDSDIIAAMRWAAGLSSEPVANAHPARVVNLSLGSAGGCSSAYRETVAELAAAGVAVVAANGNDAGLAVNTPANCAGAIAVAGVRHLGSKVGYSNLGPQTAIAAPAGNCVNLEGACLYPLLTTTNTGSTAPAANTFSDGYNYSVGTSFATPLVAGAAALLLSIDTSLTPARLKSVLQATARAFPATGAEAGVAACRAPDGVEQIECYCTTTTCGAGLLDAGAAAAQVQASLVPPPTAVLTVVDAQPSAGSVFTLDASASTAQGGRTVAAYRWAITAGSDIAAFSGDSQGAIVRLLASAAGTVTVSLTVTDSAGASATTSRSITVAAAPATTGGTGGGALGPLGLLALAATLLALRGGGRRDGR